MLVRLRCRSLAHCLFMYFYPQSRRVPFQSVTYSMYSVTSHVLGPFISSQHRYHRRRLKQINVISVNQSMHTNNTCHGSSPLAVSSRLCRVPNMKEESVRHGGRSARSSEFGFLNRCQDALAAFSTSLMKVRACPSYFFRIINIFYKIILGFRHLTC